MLICYVNIELPRYTIYETTLKSKLSAISNAKGAAISNNLRNALSLAYSKQ